MVLRCVSCVLFAAWVIAVNPVAAAPAQGTATSPEASAAIVVFTDPGFPSADSAKPSESQLRSLFSGAQFASVEQLKTILRAPGARLLVLPYGSAFPEE